MVLPTIGTEGYLATKVRLQGGASQRGLGGLRMEGILLNRPGAVAVDGAVQGVEKAIGLVHVKIVAPQSAEAAAFQSDYLAYAPPLVSNSLAQLGIAGMRADPQSLPHASEVARRVISDLPGDHLEGFDLAEGDIDRAASTLDANLFWVYEKGRPPFHPIGDESCKRQQSSKREKKVRQGD